MTQYINKSDVVAEIRKRLLPVIRDKHYDEWEEGQDSERKAILGILDTLEVKDVDLNREIEKEIETRWRGEYLFTTKFKESAKHFFELGIKAQKGE